MNSADIFHVETVETTATPAGMEQGPWCRYVVASRRSRVVGRYRGTLLQARRNAELLASGINERVRDGRCAWAPRPQLRNSRKARGKRAN